MMNGFLPLASIMFSFMFMIGLANYNPSLATLATALSGAFVVVRVSHERKKLPRFLMDVLDRLTNRSSLEAAYEAKSSHTVEIDAEALAMRVKAKIIGQDACVERVALQLRRRFAARRPDKPIAVSRRSKATASC